MADAGHHGGAISLADTAGIFREGHIQSPVQGILNPPMPTDCLGNSLASAGMEAIRQRHVLV